MKNNIKGNQKFDSNIHKKCLVGAGLFVGMTSTFVFGNSLKNNEYLYNVAFPVKELINEHKNYNNLNVAQSNSISKSDMSSVSVLQNNNEFVYLSNIPYISEKSSTAYGSITMDKNLSNNLISVMVNGEKKYFLKGVFAHANATIAYDLTGYDYDYFTAYLGVDTGAGNNGNGVRFEVHTSEDGENWTLQERVNNNAVFKGTSDAYFLKYPIKEVNYIKIVIQNNGGNMDSDHSVLANAKLVKESYDETAQSTVDWIKPLSYYDDQVKKYNDQQLLKDNQLVLYQREFVNKVGYDNLQMLASYDKSTEKAIKWLFDDAENLRMYLISGAPDGSYITSLQVLTRLYENYHEDFDNTEPTKYGYTTMGTLYRRMAISLSLTHSKVSYFWMNGGGQTKTNSDAVNRYRIFKEIYLTGRMRFTSQLDYTKWFEQYEIGEMRYVMNSIMDDDEMIWLNDYTQSFIDAHPNNPNWYLSPHPYMKYIWPNYGRAEYYAEENKEKWDEKYKGIFSKYGVPYGEKGVARTWMNIEGGAVCGGISKQGASNQNAHGVPATVVSQPGHAAFAYYQMNNNGDGYWYLNNWITGWQQSGKTERLNDRAPLGWGNDSYVSGWAASYILLAQEAMNHNTQYEASEKYIMIAETYKDNASKREEYLRKSLKSLPYNVDAWWALIQLYNQDSTKTEQDYYELASDLADALMPFPLPMKNLLDQLAGKFTSADFVFKYNLLVVNKLTEGKNLPNSATDKVYTPSYTRDIASFLLGSVNTSLATFSFDGENAGKIVLGSHVDSYDVHWDYSLDGKKTWKEVYFRANEPHFIQLTDEELASITDENNIYVHLLGVSPEYNDTNTFKIEITSGTYPSNIYGNDLENKIMGDTSLLEWRFSDSDEWHLFRNEEPDLTGNKTITVRLAATGTKLASESHTYTFTQDIENPHMKYIPISHLSINGYSSQSKDTNRPFYAPNAIDGNGTTLWHTDFAQNVLQQSVKPYISIELDEAKNLSGLEFMQIKYPNKPQDPDQIKNARVYVSSNGNDWIEAGKVENCSTYGSLYRIEFEQSVYGKYVKLEMDTYNMFASLAMVNLYENTEVTLSASFSLDGENAGKIILNGDDLNFAWSYSLDGENTWHNVTGAEYKLSEIELESLNVTDGIVIRRNNSDSKYIIHLTKSPVPQRAYLNDLENRLIAVSNSDRLEWKIDGTEKWISYSEQEPIVRGDKTLLVRVKANGVALPSDAIEYKFTKDVETEEKKYISVKHMSIHSVSSEATAQGRYAKNIIDGNPNTSWHSNWNGNDRTKELVIKLDKAKYISSLEYLPLAGGNGKPEIMTILVSMDGVNYTEVAETNWKYANTNDVTLKSIDFEPTKGQYIKIVGKKTQSASSLSFMAGAMINLYEDTTKEDYIDQNVELKYSTKNLTNQDVTVTVVCDNAITITNNNGSNEYTFTKNGSFTFEYVDANDEEKTILAVVDWIDKIAPTADVQYNISSLTNQNVVATIQPSEDVTITNNNGSNEYTFTENGEFTFEFVDNAGNKGTATAFVSWINKNAPYGSITYSQTTLTNQDVLARLNVEKGVTITNNNGSNEYVFTKNGEFTFEFVDEYGNIGKTTATVNWIDKVAPEVEISYNTTSQTDKEVVATITANEAITITNNEGKTSYTFTENGSFTFEYVDKAGNKGSIVATVDWIKKFDNKISFSFDKETLTDQDVTVTLLSERPITIINNNGSNKYTFTENGDFIFEYIDEYGDAGLAKVTVDWIDKVELKVDVSYNITSSTSEKVIATVSANKNIVITNNGGNKAYTFTKNGEFTFEYVDPYGNKGSITASVDWINKLAPSAEVTYSTKDLTNQDVVVKLVNPNNKLTILNNNGSDTYIFTKNGEFVFEYVDEDLNKGSTYVNVTWIDKEAPTAEVEFSTTDKTNKDVVVTLQPNEEVTITNNNGSNEYTFTKNGTFTFEYIDKAGNKGKTEVNVDWIYKKKPLLYVEFSTENVTTDQVIATLILRDGIKVTNNEGKNTYVFIKNGTFTFEYIDEYGNVGTTTAEVNWIKEDNGVSENPSNPSDNKPSHEEETNTSKNTNVVKSNKAASKNKTTGVVTSKPTEEVSTSTATSTTKNHITNDIKKTTSTNIDEETDSTNKVDIITFVTGTIAVIIGLIILMIVKARKNRKTNY